MATQRTSLFWDNTHDASLFFFLPLFFVNKTVTTKVKKKICIMISGRTSNIYPTIHGQCKKKKKEQKRTNKQVT